jgi:hypothetical protein
MGELASLPPSDAAAHVQEQRRVPVIGRTGLFVAELCLGAMTIGITIAAGPRQRKMSDGEVISTQVQPVSLYTR